jgi:hypothetical protein
MAGAQKINNLVQLIQKITLTRSFGQTVELGEWNVNGQLEQCG